MRLRLSDLAPGIVYTFQLRSNTGEAVSEWSRVFTVTTSSDAVAPNTPTGVAATMDGTSFGLSWSKVLLSADGTAANDLDHYEVLVSSTGTATTGLYAVTDIKFLFTLEMNRALFGSPRANVIMQVRAVDKNGNSSAYSSNFPQTNPAPANPTNLTATGTVDAISIKWDAVTDADLAGYRIYSGTTAGTQTTLVWQGGATSANILSTLYSVDRWYKVAAFDVFGTESTTPPVAGPVRPTSPFIVDTTPPAVPTGLTAVLTTASDTTTSAAVSWTAVTDTDGDLAGYQIGYRPVGASDWQYTTVDYTITSTRIDRLTPYNEYEFRIRAYDFQANYSAWSSTVTTTTAAVNVAPSTPAAPTAAAGTMKIQVTHNGQKAAGGAMESDVVYYEVYVSSVSGFTPATSNMAGRINVGPSMVQDFFVPASAASGTTQTLYVKVIAVDALGLKSAASAQATANTNLIATANIGDAVITNAKIGDLAANKITAGTGFINDITVKSKFTLGDASTTGIIESYGYVAGTTGFHLDKTLLEINQGSIAAAALKIQDSDNILTPDVASFNFVPTYYTSSVINTTSNTGSGVVTIDSTLAKFGTQSAKLVRTGTGGYTDLLLSSSNTDYRYAVEPNTDYIISAWIMTPNASGAKTVAFVNRGASAAAEIGLTTVVDNGVWQRISATFNSGADSLMTFAIRSKTDNSTIYVDGVQVERKIGALSTPSPWTPPGITSVDAGIIRTGEIRSTSTLTVNGVTQPNWSINVGGGMQIGSGLVRGNLIIGQANTNIAPNGGTFESSVTGYSAYGTGATSLALTRVTTGQITGTGSAKTTAAAGAKATLGLYFNITTIPAGVGFTVRCKYKSDVDGTFKVQLHTQLATIASYEENKDVRANTVYQHTRSYISTQDVKRIMLYMDNTTATAVTIDDIEVLVDPDLGNSVIESGNYVTGISGWMIDSSGNVEMNNGVFRGRLEAVSITGANFATSTTGGAIIIDEKRYPGYAGGEFKQGYIEFGAGYSAYYGEAIANQARIGVESGDNGAPKLSIYAPQRTLGDESPSIELYAAEIGATPFVVPHVQIWGGDHIGITTADGSSEIPITASGSLSIAAVANGATANYTVTFPAGMNFNTIPKVFVMVESTRINAIAGSRTTTGFTFQVSNWSGTTSGTATGIWFATT